MEIKVVNRSYKDRDTHEIKSYEVVVLVCKDGTEVDLYFKDRFQKNFVMKELKGNNGK